MASCSKEEPINRQAVHVLGEVEPAEASLRELGGRAPSFSENACTGTDSNGDRKPGIVCWQGAGSCKAKGCDELVEFPNAPDQELEELKNAIISDLEEGDRLLQEMMSKYGSPFDD